MAGNKEERKGLSVSDTLHEPLQCSIACSAENPSSLLCWELQRSSSTHRTPIAFITRITSQTPMASFPCWGNTQPVQPLKVSLHLLLLRVSQVFPFANSSFPNPSPSPSISPQCQVGTHELLPTHMWLQSPLYDGHGYTAGPGHCRCQNLSLQAETGGAVRTSVAHLGTTDAWSHHTKNHTVVDLVDPTVWDNEAQCA